MAVIEAIATTYLEADTASVTFSSIPATYEHLQLRMNIHTVRASALEATAVRFNGDTGSNYTSFRMLGQDTTPLVGKETGQNRAYATGQMPTTTSKRPLHGSGLVDILDYANTNKNTTILFLSGQNDATYPYVTIGSALWDATAAVATILLYPLHGSDFARGSEFTLYGLNSS
jgi:hypothetical protein